MTTRRPHLLALILAGCAPSAPASPTWVEDVRPILQASCVRCHTPPPIFGAPTGFRLDRFDDTVHPDGSVTRGAGTMAPYLAARAGIDGAMPPDWPLSDYQREVLSNWCFEGDDVATDRCYFTRPEEGARRENRPPVMEADLPASSDGGPLEVAYRLSDPDGDLVHGVIRLDVDDPASALPGTLESGAGTFTWDAGAAGPGSYDLWAVVDDGTAETRISLGAVEVTGGNTAPAPVITFPGRDEVLHDADSPHEINVAIADADLGDEVSFDVDAFRGGQVIEIGRGVAAAPTPGNPAVRAGAVAWATDDLTAAGNWRLRVTVTDGTTSRTVESDDLIITHAAAEVTFAEVTGYFESSCTSCCHGAYNRIPDLSHLFTVYASGEMAGVRYLGSYDLRGVIYRRVVQAKDMPPPSAAILCPDEFEPLTDDERADIAAWVLGGAPE